MKFDFLVIPRVISDKNYKSPPKNLILGGDTIEKRCFLTWDKISLTFGKISVSFGYFPHFLSHEIKLKSWDTHFFPCAGGMEHVALHQLQKTFRVPKPFNI